MYLSSITENSPHIPWVKKIPWRRKWQPTPVFLPGKSDGRRSLVDYSPGGHKKVGHNLVTKQQKLSIMYLILFQW